MKPFYKMTDAELVSDEGLAELEQAVQWDVEDGSASDMEKTVPVLTAEIRRLRSGPPNVDVVIQLLEQMTPGERASVAEYLDDQDEDDFEPAPPVYGPLTYMEYLMRRLQEHMLEQLCARPPDRPRMVGLSELLDHVAAHQKHWMTGDHAATDDHARHAAEHMECRRTALAGCACGEGWDPTVCHGPVECVDLEETP